MAVRVEHTFVTFTPPAGARALIGDFTDWDRREPIAVTGADIVLEFPRNSWIEYAWVGEDGKPFADPDNPRRSLNPWWPYPRAVEIGTYPLHPLLAEPGPEVPRGRAERLAWEGGVFGGTRRAYVYTPPNYDPARRYPVFYVQDGVAFYRTGRLGEIADLALHQGLTEPAVFVFLEPGDRSHEYYLNDDYLRFLEAEVFPRVEGEFAVRTDPQGRGLWGASLGGLISLYTAAHHPEQFSRVVSHSGAFLADPGSARRDTRGASEWLRGALSSRPPEHLRVAMDSGTIEWLLAPNRRMAALFQDLGIAHQYREYASGHNWVSWRNALPEALLYQLGKGAAPV
ncbi:enterochelin esterase family protein [Deinobacterium chartae]|uniref:Enterochelin esterase family protein n=1 Tax=Deinobacterium chartae TaxID=521158 RepID=A0A841HY57_9DEIO|nr:alpha/beta hydrolase-fold protein [Deinobacterium chartae]MBB6098327.1 enterochelin esterase family protein [Deinobacterium chartae]